eukprot:4266783-Lingulodinium_polyedra.AAC.1
MHAMQCYGAVESTFCHGSGSQSERARVPCARQFSSARAWSPRAYGSRAVAAAKRRFDSIIAQRS